MTAIQRYADRHVNLQGPGDQRPTAEEVIRDQHLVGALLDTTVLITGCTSGIGIETARALYLTGAHIYITGRNISKANEVASELSTDPTRPVKVVELSLDSFASIRAAAKKFLTEVPKLNILINNAGIMACPYSKTQDGHELQFGTNHLGHFLLFQLLKPALLAAATPDRPSRVISVSSTGHRMTPNLPFDDLDFSKSSYDPTIAYGRSKLANIYFANELTRRYANQNLIALSLHPGSIETPLRRFFLEAADERVLQIIKQPEYVAQAKNVQQGAATTVWAAVGKEWTTRGGVYLEDVGEAGPMAKEGAPYRTGYSEAAYNPKDEERLWEISSKICESTVSTDF